MVFSATYPIRHHASDDRKQAHDNEGRAEERNDGPGVFLQLVIQRPGGEPRYRYVLESVRFFEFADQVQKHVFPGRASGFSSVEFSLY